MDVLKAVLVVFLVVAVLTVVVVFIRNVRAKGFPTRRSSDHFDQIYFGASAPTPTPDWAQDSDGDSRR